MGVDIGTTAVKALAVDENGEVVARSRVAHRILASEADQLRHDARRAWRAGPAKAYAELSSELAAAGNGEIAGVAVTSMVPSLTAVNRRGVPTLPGVSRNGCSFRQRRDVGPSLSRRDSNKLCGTLNRP